MAEAANPQRWRQRHAAECDFHNGRNRLFRARRCQTGFAAIPAALRMRAFRRRRRTGDRCVQIQIGPREIDRLIAKGYLGRQEREDLKGIGAAASWSLAEALLGPAT